MGETCVNTQKPAVNRSEIGIVQFGVRKLVIQFFDDFAVDCPEAVFIVVVHVERGVEPGGRFAVSVEVACVVGVDTNLLVLLVVR
jgi:hypothetical protein